MRSLQKFTLAVALYIALALNSSLSFLLHQFFAYGDGANLLLPVGIMLVALFDDINPKEIWLALGAGVVSDIYFYGIIGIYTVSLPCICWLLQQAARFLPEVFWVRIIAVLLGSAAVTVYSWAVLNLTGIISAPLPALLLSLVPTLAWSLVFAILSYRIWDWLAIRYPFMVNLDNYRQ